MIKEKLVNIQYSLTGNRIALFFSWQLLLRVHRHGKELQNTQKINVSTEIKTSSQAGTCFCFCQAAWSKSADLGSSTWSTSTTSPTLSWNVQNRSLISTLNSGATLDTAAGQLFLFIVVYWGRELISSVWWDPTQKSPFIYKTEPRGRFPVSHYKDHEWQYFTSSTSWGESCCH